MKIAIIGAGLSGANIYSLFKKDGHDVTIFEKARGAGGRCSTRYIDDKFIDHGTPFFKASNDTFIEFCQKKVVEKILVKKENYYYPTNGMNKLCSSLIDKSDIIQNTKIVSCKLIHKKWKLTDENNMHYNSFDKLIITIPSVQILELDIELTNHIKEALATVKYNSIASLLIYSNSIQNTMNQKLLNDRSFKKIVDNSSKYNYKNFSSYVIHLSEDVTNGQNFKNKEEVQEFMLQKIYTNFGIVLEDDFHIMPHFWKYGFVAKSIDEDCFYNKNLSLGICGDYFKYSDLEGTYLSSKSLYEKILQ
jgi:hypothetical protein